MNISSVTMQVRVPDAAEAAGWYEGLLGRPADIAPSDDIHEWQLVPDCWLQVLTARPKPTAARMRFGVGDIRGEIARLETDLGVTASDIQSFGGLVAWCDFADPYGNPIGLFQDLAKHPLRDAS